MPFDISRLLKHTKTLAKEFPHRHAGEPEQQEAAHYIADQLRECGLVVHEIETPILGWEITAGPDLEITSPIHKVVECAPYVYSGSTPDDGYSGELTKIGPVYVGSQEPWWKYAIIDEAGRKRVLIVGRTDGPAIGRRGTPAGTGITADGPSYSWPSCVVGREDMDLFDKWLDQGLLPSACYAVQTRHKPNCPSITVQGVLPGHTYPEEVVVFGVHHDAVGAIGYPQSVDSPGANDNASGVAVMLETARQLAARGTPRTVWFCSFDGEERNHLGSSNFVRTLAEQGQLDQVIAYVGIDQAAYGDKFWVLASGDAAHLRPQLNLRELAQGVIDEIKLSERSGTHKPSPLHAASDHWPFYYAGVPAILTGWHPFEGYHRATDTVERCDNDHQFLTTAIATERLLDAVLNQPTMGTVKRPPSAGYVMSPPGGDIT